MKYWFLNALCGLVILVLLGGHMATMHLDDVLAVFQQFAEFGILQIPIQFALTQLVVTAWFGNVRKVRIDR